MKFRADEAAVEAAIAVVQAETKTSRVRAVKTVEALFGKMGIDLTQPDDDGSLVDETPHWARWAVLALVSFTVGVIVFQVVKGV